MSSSEDDSRSQNSEDLEVDSDFGMPDDADFDSSSAGGFETASGSEPEDEEMKEKDNEDEVSTEDEDEDGAFEEGDYDVEHLTKQALSETLASFRNSADVKGCLQMLVSIYRNQMPDAPLARFQFEDDVDNLRDTMYDVFDILKTLVKEKPADMEDKKTRDQFKRFWLETRAFLAVASSRHPLVKCLVISLDKSMIETLWSVRYPSRVLRIWQQLVMSAVVNGKADFCPPFISGFFKTFSDPVRVKCLVTVIRKMLAIIRRHFALRRARKSVVDMGKTLLLHIAAILYELQNAGFYKEVYDACSWTLRDIILTVGRYMVMNSRSIGGDKKKQEVTKANIRKLKDLSISWGTLNQLGLFISVMILERTREAESGDRNPCGLSTKSPTSLHRLSEPLLALLFSLARANKNNSMYLPFHVKVLGLCLSMSKATQLYCPLGSLICEFGELITKLSLSRKVNTLVKNQKNLLKPINLSSALVVTDEHLGQPYFQEAMFSVFRDMLVDHLCQLAHHPAFPEISNTLMTTAQKKFSFDPHNQCLQTVKSLTPVVSSTAETIVQLRKGLIEETFVDPETTMWIIPHEKYSAFDLVRYANQRQASDFLFLF